MLFNFKKGEYHPSPLLRAVQWFLLVLIVFGVGLLLTQKIWVPRLVYYILKNEAVNSVPLSVVVPPVQQNSKFDVRNAQFTIDGSIVTLKDGVSEISAIPGSATKVITRYFGNEAVGDVNGDGQPDIAFLVTQETGGSGLFYYVTVAVKKGDAYASTNAVLIGDRIAPQSTAIQADGEMQVNYADRKAGEPMTAQPSVGTTLRLNVTPAGVLEKIPAVGATAPMGKLNVHVVCEGALAYMTFENTERASAFVAECVEGKHPEVIERYLKSLNHDGATI